MTRVDTKEFERSQLTTDEHNASGSAEFEKSSIGVTLEKREFDIWQIPKMCGHFRRGVFAVVFLRRSPNRYEKREVSFLPNSRLKKYLKNSSRRGTLNCQLKNAWKLHLENSLIRLLYRKVKL